MPLSCLTFLFLKTRFSNQSYIYNISKFRKCSLVVDKHLRSGLKAQQAHSPGHALGYVLVAPSYAEKGARNRRETLHKALLA